MKEGLDRSSPARSSSQLDVQREAHAPSAGRGPEEEDEAAGAQRAQDVKDTAAQGVAGASSALPHAARIQESFGKHDVSKVKARTGGAAKDAAGSIGAQAYAQGEKTAFASTPDLHTAAHEAAHVMQQRAGKTPPGGVGEEGDALEKEADAVADKVVAGDSAEAALDAMGGGDDAGDDAGDAVQNKPVQKLGGGGQAPSDPGADGAVQKKASPGAGGSDWGLAPSAPGDAVQRVAVQRKAGPKKPTQVTLRVGGVPVLIALPPEFEGTTYTKTLARSLAPGVTLRQIRVRFDDRWVVQGGSVSGDLGAALGDKKLKTSWKLGVGKAGVVSGHIKDAPIEDGPLKGTLSASWGGKKLKARAKATLTGDLGLGQVKGFGARLLAGTNADVSFTHDTLLRAKSTQAAIMLTQKGVDRVKLSGKGSYVAPKKFQGDGDVDVVKPFDIDLPKFKLRSGRRSKGRFSFGSWSFRDLPLDLHFGGGLLKSMRNKLKFGGFGLGGLGSFQVKNPFKLPTLGGWTPKLGGGSTFDFGFARSMLNKLKGVADWKLAFGGKDVFSGLWKGIRFDPKTWTFSGFGAADLIGDLSLGTFKGFDFRALGRGKKFKLPRLSLKKNVLTDFLGKINLGVWKGPKFAFGSVDLSWLKGKGLRRGKGSFTFPSMPTFSMSPYSVRLDKDSKADADFSNNTLNSVSGRVGATVLKGKAPLVHGRLETARINPGKRRFSGDGSMNLLARIPLVKKAGWQGTLLPSKAKSVTFRFADSDLKRATGAISVQVDRGGKKLVELAATGVFDGKDFTGKGSAKLAGDLPFQTGRAKGVINRVGSSLNEARMVRSALKGAGGDLSATLRSETKAGPLDVTGTVEKARLDLGKAPSVTGSLHARLNKTLTLGQGPWTTRLLKDSAATLGLVHNQPRTLKGEPLKILVLKDGKKAAEVRTKGTFNARTLVLDATAKGTLFKGVQLHDKPRTVVSRNSPLEKLVIKANRLQEARGSLSLDLADAAGKAVASGDLKGAYVARRGFSGHGKVQIKRPIALKKKGAYQVTLEPTQGPTVDAVFSQSRLKSFKGNLSARIDEGKKPLARAEVTGRYDGKNFTGAGKARLLRDLSWQAGKTKATLEKKGTALDLLRIRNSAFVEAKGRASLRLKRTTESGLLDVRGQIKKAVIDSRKKTSVSGALEATLLADYTVGKGAWQTRVQRGARATVQVRDTALRSLETGKIGLIVLKDKKKAARVNAKVKFNLRTLMLEARGDGELFQDLELGTSPRVVVDKASKVTELNIKANAPSVIDGQISLAVYDKQGSQLVKNAYLKGKWTRASGFTGEGGGKTARAITAGKPGGYRAVLAKDSGVDKIKVRKGRFLEARGGKLGVSVHDEQGELLSGSATLESLVRRGKGYAFSGGGELAFGRSLKLGKKGGRGVRIVEGTKLAATVKDNRFTRVTGALWVRADGRDGKEVAEGQLTDVDINMAAKDPVVSGKGSFRTSRAVEIGKLVTVHKDLMAFATVQKNELTEAGVANAAFTVHKLNDGRGARGTVAKADLHFGSGGLPELEFRGGAIERFELLRGKLVGSLQELSFKDHRVGGRGSATYAPNKLFKAFAALRFDPTDASMLPWVTLKGDVTVPVLKKKTFFERGMPGAKPWTLVQGGVDIKGVQASLAISAGYELGTTPVVMQASLENSEEFNPEKLELPDFRAKAKVSGKAYARGHLTMTGRLGVGRAKTAFFGLAAKASLQPKLSASLTPSGTVFARGGKLGGDIDLDFNVAGTAALKTSLDLIAEFLGMDTTLANFGKETVDFGELFSFGYKGRWAFGEAAGKAPLTGDSALGDDPRLLADTTRAFDKDKKVGGAPVRDLKETPGAGAGGMKALEDKMAIMKVLAALTKAGIKLIDLGVSSLPPSIRTIKAVVFDNKAIAAAEACVDLTDEINRAEDSGLLQKMIDKGGAIGWTMRALRKYAQLIDELSGPSVKEMFENSAGVYNFKGNAWVFQRQAMSASKVIKGYEDPEASIRARTWRSRPAFTMSDVSHRGVFSRLQGALDTVHVIDAKPAAMQEMSKKDYRRRLNKFKAEWKKKDQPIIDKWLPPNPKYRLAD